MLLLVFLCRFFHQLFHDIVSSGLETPNRFHANLSSTPSIMKARRIDEDPLPPFKASFSPVGTPVTARKASLGSPCQNGFSPSKMLFSPSPTPAKTLSFHRDTAIDADLTAGKPILEGTPTSFMGLPKNPAFSPDFFEKKGGALKADRSTPRFVFGLCSSSSFC